MDDKIALNLKKKISKYEYISFDIFDTLVQRMLLSNKELFYYTDLIYQIRYKKKLDNYVENRQKIEEELWEKTSKGNFSFHNIFNIIGKIYGEPECGRLSSIELELESLLDVRNENIYSIYQYAIKNSKVIITSDMYLEKEYLEKLLDALGIKGYEKIYISGDCCCSKAEGTIFPYIIKDLNSKSILHIGDSFKGDYIMPKIYGLDSHIIKRKRHYYFNTRNVDINTKLLIGMATVNKFNTNNEYWESTGYSILGPFLLAFAQWIKVQVDNEEIKNIVFFARDGYIIKKAFDLLYKNQYKTQYMYISRKVANFARVKETNTLDEILSLFKFRKNESFKQVLSRLGVCKEDMSDVVDFTVSRKQLYLGKYNSLIEPFFSKIIKKASNQKLLLSQYVDSIIADKTAVVDIGWHGTIQNSIQLLIGSKYQLKGLYLGLEKNKDEHKLQFLSSDLFDPDMIPFVRGVFETFFSAPHPSTDGYEVQNNTIYPIFSKTEVSKNTEEKIKLLHKGAIAFVKEYKKVTTTMGLTNYRFDNKLISQMFLSFCNSPKMKDVNNFGSLDFNDTVNRKLIDYKNYHFLSNLESFFQSDWKAGFAKKILKLNLSYGILLSKLNKFRR